MDYSDSSPSSSSSRHRLCCSSPCCGDGIRATTITISLLSLLLIALSTLTIYLPPYIQNTLDSGIDQYVYFDPNDLSQEGFRTWASSLDSDSQQVFYDVYVMNITNTEEVLLGGPMNVEEIGPFSFIQQTVRYNYTFHYDYFNQLYVRYYEWQYYVFNPSTSVFPTMDMNITTYQLAYTMLGVLDKTFLTSSQSTCFHNSSQWNKFFVSVTVNEFLNGYQSSYIDCLMNILTNGGKKQSPISLPGVIGFLGNSTQQDADNLGFTEIYVGNRHGQASLTRSYKSWSSSDMIVVPPPPTLPVFVWGQLESPFPSGISTNNFKGTDGTQFHVGVEGNSSLISYVISLFRPITLINLENEKVSVEGISLYRFRLDETQLLNVTNNPLNEPYYTFHYNGFLDLSHAHSGIPIFVSLPHFILVDSQVTQHVTGLSTTGSDKDMYSTHLDVEPITGATMQAHKRIQINVKFTKGLADIFLPINDLDMFIPLLWTDEHGVIDSDKADTFKKSVYLAINFQKYFVIFAYSFSVVIVVIIVFLHWRMAQKMKWMAFQGDMKERLIVDS